VKISYPQDSSATSAPAWCAPSCRPNRYVKANLLYLPNHKAQSSRPSSQRFLREGCPNCEDFLRLTGSIDAIQECTSQVFEGLITLSDPSKSWVAKWQRLDGYVRGVYATKVSGILPEEVVETMETEARVRYIPYV
jgi:transcription elongation factor SPT4